MPRAKSPTRSKKTSGKGKRAKSPSKNGKSGKLKKGSEEAKRRMAYVRSFRKKKGGKKPTKKVQPASPRKTKRKTRK